MDKSSLLPNDQPPLPLFGETRRRDKIINIVVAIVTAVIVGFVGFWARGGALGTRLPKRYPHFVTVSLLYVVSFLMQLTVVMAFISSLLLNPQKCQRLLQAEKTAFCIYFVDIILCVVIIALLVPQIVVAYWYRKGELEPKFRTLIYYNALVTIVLCICGNLYFFQAGFATESVKS